MTDQELFDKVVAHLRAQKVRAVDKSGRCRYRAPDGKMCAAGCLILGEHHSPDIEGRAADTSLVRKSLFASGVLEGQLQLVMYLQRVHDNFMPYHWEAELAYVAKLNGLTTPVAP